MKADRNPTEPHSFRYRLIFCARFLKSCRELYSLPSWHKSCTPTSNPTVVRKSRRLEGVSYSPSGTKLKDDRNPKFISRSARSRHRSSPLCPSTSWVRTKANFFCFGQPFHQSGTAPANWLIGQDAQDRRIERFAMKRRTAIRNSRGSVGLAWKYVSISKSLI